MEQTFLIAGLACLIAAVVGGGLKAFGIEIPLLSSGIRQFILGLLGVVLIVVSVLISGSIHNQVISKKPVDSPKTEDKGDKEKGNTAIENKQYTGQIIVTFNSSPYSLPAAGGQVDLNVLAVTEQNEPLPDASVKIESGGGWYAISGTNVEVGKTNANGVFTTKWKSPDNPGATGFGMVATVNKEGAIPGSAEFTVRIDH